MSEQLHKEKMTGMCSHGNFPDRCKICGAESEMKFTAERALEILGADRFFGAEQVKNVFGFVPEGLPEFPFSRQEIERAKESGASLVLRIDRFEDGMPMTVSELVRRSNENHERVFADSSDISDELDWVEGMSFQEKTTPSLEWKLVASAPIEETKHLSFEAQQAFMANNEAALRGAVDKMQAFWDELLEDDRNSWLREHVESARVALPTVEDLMELRSSLPDQVSLPSVVEALYDARLKGQLFENMAVVTGDTVEPFEDEPERPIDLSFVDGKPSLHVRRDKRFGRPHKLGKDEGFVSGIPIGYIQY